MTCTIDHVQTRLKTRFRIHLVILESSILETSLSQTQLNCFSSECNKMQTARRLQNSTNIYNK